MIIEDDMERMWKQPWSNLKYYLAIASTDRKIMKSPSHEYGTS
jgi:hypothetical protein